MIAKVNDENVTAEMVDAMTDQELKAFENRLRSMSFKQGLEFCKYRVFPDDKLVYAAFDPERRTAKEVIAKNRYDLSLLKMRDYLYGVK